MDSIFETIVIISVIWSIISSITSKKKQNQKNSTSETDIETEENLLKDLNNLIQSIKSDVNPNTPSIPYTTPTIQERKPTEFHSPIVAKPKSQGKNFKSEVIRRKSHNKRLDKIKIDEFDYNNHAHLPHEKPSSKTIPSPKKTIHPVIDKLNSQTLLEGIILTEILNKPLSLRNK